MLSTKKQKIQRMISKSFLADLLPYQRKFSILKVVPYLSYHVHHLVFISAHVYVYHCYCMMPLLMLVYAFIRGQIRYKNT